MKSQKPTLLSSVLFPLLFTMVMWGVFAIEYFDDRNFASWGIYPRDITGLRGILFAPFIHGGIDHLLNNTYPVLFLGTAIFYFYRKVAFQIVVYSILFTGFWVWVGARPSFHIGASGVIYAWGSFLFFSGMLNKNTRMMGLSLLIVFLYGSMVWGVLPLVEHISWESHLFGAISGAILAWFYRKEGPQRKKYSWELEEEESFDHIPWQKGVVQTGEEEKEGEGKKNSGARQATGIVYHYKRRSLPSDHDGHNEH